MPGQLGLSIKRLNVFAATSATSATLNMRSSALWSDGHCVLHLKKISCRQLEKDPGLSVQSELIFGGPVSLRL